jgi:hypothetical protein
MLRRLNLGFKARCLDYRLRDFSQYFQLII